MAAAMVSALKATYAPRDRVIKNCRELRFMEKPVYVPPAYKASAVEVRTPLMNDLVQRLAGALSVNPPQVKVPPRPKGDQDQAQRNSTKLERWSQAFLIEIEHQENDRIFYRFLDYLCGDGHGILKLVHRDECWSDLPILDEGKELNAGAARAYNEERENTKSSLPIPFSLKVVDPLSFFPRYTDFGIRDVIEVTKRPKIYVATEYAISKWEDGKPVLLGRGVEPEAVSNMDGECEFWEHWTQTEVDYYVDGVWVGGHEHNYGFVPYFHAMGTQTSSRDADKEGLSVGHQLTHILPALDSLLTMKTNSAFMSAYPSFKRERDMGAPRRLEDSLDDDNDTGEESGEEFEPGHIYDGLPGERLEPIMLPGVGKDVDDSIQHLLGVIDKVGVPSVLSGMHTPNRVSGYAYSEMLNVSRTKYTTIVRNASFAFESMFKRLWWLVEHRVGESVPIYGTIDSEGKTGWLDIGPNDVRGYQAVKVIIEPLLPEDDIAQGQHAAAMVQGGLWSKRYAREMKMGIPNPEEMDDEILVEHAMELPQLQMYILMKALERREQEELAEVFQMTADMVQQGLVDAVQGNNSSTAGAPGQKGMPNLAPNAGGGMMPGQGNPPPPGATMGTSQQSFV